jgi:hypothetical protein
MANKDWDFPIRKTRKKKATEPKTEVVSKLIAQKEAELEELKKAAENANCKIANLVARGIEISQYLEHAKDLYREQDEIIEQLLETGETQFEHKDGVLTLVDLFTEKNRQWKSVPFNRFTIEVTGKGRA